MMNEITYLTFFYLLILKLSLLSILYTFLLLFLGEMSHAEKKSIYQEEEEFNAIHASQEPDLSDLYPSPTAWKSLLNSQLIYHLTYYYLFTTEAKDEFHALYGKLKHHLYVTFLLYCYRLIRHIEREPCEMDFWHYTVPESTGSPKIRVTKQTVQKMFQHFLAHKKTMSIGSAPIDVFHFHVDDFECPTLRHNNYIDHVDTNNANVQAAIKKWRWLEHEGITPEWLWQLRTAVIWEVKPYYNFFLDATNVFKQLYATLPNEEYKTFLRYCEMMLKHLACEIQELPFWFIEAPGYAEFIVVTAKTINAFYSSFLANRKFLSTFDYSKSMFVDSHVYFLPQHPNAKYEPSQLTYQYREYKARFFWHSKLPKADFRKELTKTVQSLYRSVRDHLL